MRLKMNRKNHYVIFNSQDLHAHVQILLCWIPHIFCISILWCHVLCLWSSCSERRTDWMVQKHWWHCCSDVTFQREFHLKVRRVRANSQWLTVRQGWRKKLEISVKDLPKVTNSENYLSNVAAPLLAVLHCKVWQVSPGSRLSQRQLSRTQGRWRFI